MSSKIMLRVDGSKAWAGIRDEDLMHRRLMVACYFFRHSVHQQHGTAFQVWQYLSEARRLCGEAEFYNCRVEV